LLSNKKHINLLDETRQHNDQQRYITRIKQQAKADGTIITGEKGKINRKQNRVNRNIFRQKYDWGWQFYPCGLFMSFIKKG